MWTECPHPATEIRRKVNTAGLPMCARQCTTCGANIGGWLPKTQWPHVMPMWDDALQDQWWKERSKESVARAEEMRKLRDTESAAWWARYEAHIRSPEWRMIAAKVRDRERGVCQGCGNRDEYGHCHHADYTRIGEEMLFDLLWLCRSCHQRLHPHRDLSERTK